MQQDMIRVWKDEEYKQSLSQEEQAQLPESPAGEVELSEAELELINGTGAGGDGGYGGGGGGFGNYVGKGSYNGVSALGVNNNSWFCGNFSYRPTTNINAAVATPSLASLSVPVLGTGATTTTTAFDFSCSISGLAGVCLGGRGI